MKQPQLGQKVLELRLQKGLTQIELAEKCNLGLRTIQRIELAEVTPRASTIRLIFSYLDYELTNEPDLHSPFLDHSYVSLTLGVLGFIAFVIGFIVIGTDIGRTPQAYIYGVFCFSFTPAIIGLVFSFLANNKAKLSGIVLINCAGVLVITSIVTSNWLWGLVASSCYLIAGVLNFRNHYTIN